MGAWGYNFFESDHDLDVVSDMYEDAGLAALEPKAKENLKKEQVKSRQAGASSSGGTADPPPDDYPLLSMFAGNCTTAADVDLVREHLEAGALRKLIDAKRAKMEKTPDKTDKWAEFNHQYAVYEFVLLGACAMTYGCKLPADFKELLIKKYRTTTNLSRDALHGMQLALGDGPERYRDSPYDFGSKGLVEMANSRDHEQDKNSDLPWVGLNVPAPFGLFRSQPTSMREYPADVCGGCGAKDRLDGQPLLSCSKCKVKKYCGKVCQEAHFKQHKRACREV